MLQTAGISYMQLNKPQLAQLRSIATTTNTNRSAAYAQNILCFGYGECDWEQTEPQARLKSSYPKRTYDFKTIPFIATRATHGNVSINPNPTSGKISVLISGRDNYEQLQFRIKNMRGQAVFKKPITSANSQYNLEMLGKGVFVYEIIHKRERIAVGKLVIQ